MPRYRVWTYRRPAVVLGCSQRSLRDAVARRLGGRAELVQRESGGGAVLTGPWLVSASVVLPHGHSWVCDGLIDSYRQLGHLHAAALGEMGVQACVWPPQELLRAPGSVGVRCVDWACFGSLSPWEVVDAQGRKLVGLAQRRRRSGVLLVAGTLIDGPDWPLLCDAMGRPNDALTLRQRTASIAQATGRKIEPARFADLLTRRLKRALSVSDPGNCPLAADARTQT